MTQQTFTLSELADTREGLMVECPACETDIVLSSGGECPVCETSYTVTVTFDE